MVIHERFRSFSTRALGGYVGGVLAKAIGNSVEVRFLKPVMIGARLDLERLNRGQAVLRDSQSPVAEATAMKLDMEPPAVVGPAEAKAASRSYPGFAYPLVSGCFGCGPSRAEGDGLRVFPGWIPERSMVAAVWLPHASVADVEGHVWTEAIWSALDCPAVWALIATTPTDSENRVVTGTCVVEIIEPVMLGEEYVVLGWPLGTDGRKLLAGAAVMSRGGDLHALAKHTCVLTGRGVPLGLDAWRRPA